MKSNYKKLAPYIRQIDERNADDIHYELLGVSVDKCFIKSIANTVGTDWRGYKKIRRGQFCYIPDTSRRGDKIGIALLCDSDIALVSQAYTVFEISDTTNLLPEYLNLWFKRPEFDRYARFHSHGSVREIFDWEEMGNVMLPIPSIEEQQKIVDAYNAIERRISIKRQINDNLESQAYAIYKDWFVTNGAINNATECQLGEIISIFDYKRIPLSSQERAERDKIYPYYGAAGLVDYVDNYLFDGIYLLLGEDGSVIDEQGYPFLQYLSGKFWVNNHAHILTGSNGFSTEMIYLTLRKAVIKEFVSGAVQAKLSQENMKSIPAITLSNDKLLKFNNIIQPIFSKIRANQNESYALNSLKSQVLGKLSS